jgi:hypothetical protein
MVSPAFPRRTRGYENRRLCPVGYAWAGSGYTQYVGRILRSHENKTTAEVHDYLDERTGVLAAMLAKRAPGYAGLGFPDPRRLALTPSASQLAPQAT